MFFKYVGRIAFVYYVDNEKVRNITINYYLKYGLHNFETGTYYTKIFGQNGTNHVAFHGHITNLEKVKNVIAMEKILNRKKIILLNNGNPIDIDLKILDNYKNNMEYFGESAVRNLGEIITMMGLECSHITIIQAKPFSRTTFKIGEVDIDYLYHQ